MDRELPVKLTEHEVAEKGESIAAKMLRVKKLRKTRREHFKNMTAQIDAELDNMEQIAETIVAGTEARKQGDMFVDDEVVPSQGEAAAALAEVAKRAPEYHKNGELCRRDVCKRRHMTAEVCRAQGIKVEGDPLVPETVAAAITLALGSPCPGCEKPLESAVEVLKGLCETCQTQKPGEDPLAGTPEAAPTVNAEGTIEGAGPAVQSGMELVDYSAIEADDPRPRCSACNDVLNADEVAKGHGLDQKCIDAAGGESVTTEPTRDEHPPEDVDPPHAEPESEDAPAVGGEAGA